ncbi:MAG: hypothetical protein V1866_04000 [archaeon]
MAIPKPQIPEDMKVFDLKDADLCVTTWYLRTELMNPDRNKGIHNLEMLVQIFKQTGCTDCDGYKPGCSARHELKFTEAYQAYMAAQKPAANKKS